MGREQRRDRSRRTAFVVLVIACLLAGGGYVAWAATRNAAGSSIDSAATAKALKSAARGKQPVVMFQYVARDLTQSVVVNSTYAHIALVHLTDPDGRRLYSDLVCERVYYARGRGLCLVSEQRPIGPKYIAKIFDPDFKVHHEVRLAGLPSRARVSPDGRYGATTVFVLGHSYRDDSFSTQTKLIDMASGTLVVDNLEDFAVFRNDEHINERDFNFWGVTFARDSNRFYATLATGGKTYLVQGDVKARQMHVLRENVECPSLSPDNTRIAYKKRGSRGWRLTVLDLDTMKETPLAETRSIDDQVEWLDNGHILYDFYGVWKVRADGTGRPQKFLSDGRSPAVVGL
jgi:hypothetical protein